MSSKAARVLVIDDDEIIGKSFNRVLTDKGYDTTYANSGEKGIETVNSKEDFDVVFTDIVMPGVDGFEVTKQIKDRCPWTPVVVITGYGSDDNEKRASVMGVNGFVRKPLTPELIESITIKAIKDRENLLHIKDISEAIPEVITTVTHNYRAPVKVLKDAGMFLAAPFIALAYIVALPIVGMYMFANLAIESYRKKHAPEAQLEEQ